MRSFQVLRYLKKLAPFILLFTVTMTALSYKVIKSRQIYTATAVIEYCNESASEGCAPDGTVIDTGEIYSSSNMAEVIEKLGLSYDDLDILRGSISVQPVEDGQAESIKVALNDLGEEYTVKPTVYAVSCTLGSGASEELTGNVLSALLSAYFSDYGGKHIIRRQISSLINGIADTDYDYLEIAEYIESSLAETARLLYERYGENTDFRSVKTGYSFKELADEFSAINSVDVSRLNALILGGRVSKDAEVLISRYESRIADYSLEMDKAQEALDAITELIDIYVEKNRDLIDNDSDFKYILPDVYGDGTEGEHSYTDRTTEYDGLLESWVEAKNNYDYLSLDIAYCEYVIGIFRDGVKTPPEGMDIEVREDDEHIPVPSYDTIQSVEDEISLIISKADRLYEIVNETNEEYNEYLEAENIRILSSVTVTKKINVALYTALMAMFFLVAGCCCGVIVGRAEDILEYKSVRDTETV